MELTLAQLWKTNGFKPNDNQRAAIEHVAGPLYLPAGPGSGKTRVLLWRTVNRIVFHGVSRMTWLRCMWGPSTPCASALHEPDSETTDVAQGGFSQMVQTRAF